MLAPLNRRYLPVAQSALRIAAGMAFFTHGGQKLFGWFGAGGHAQLASRFGVAGVIEVVLGACLVLGLFTQLAAFIWLVFAAWGGGPFSLDALIAPRRAAA